MLFYILVTSPHPAASIQRRHSGQPRPGKGVTARARWITLNPATLSAVGVTGQTISGQDLAAIGIAVADDRDKGTSLAAAVCIGIPTYPPTQFNVRSATGGAYLPCHSIFMVLLQ
jgi:hypothetical protein